MSVAIAIARRELSSYFRTPAGWVIIALYLLLTGFVFAFDILAPGSPASLRTFFAIAGWLLLPVAPAISMRLIADERRSGTIEALLTAPVGSGSLVAGKYLGGVAFLLLMVAPTLAYVGVLWRVASSPPDLGPILSGYACLLMLGLLYLAIGTLASSLTQNSTLAFIASLVAILGALLLPAAADVLPPALRPALAALSVTSRVNDFARGVIDTAHLVFFITTSLWLLLLAVLVMEARRWR